LQITDTKTLRTVILPSELLASFPEVFGNGIAVSERVIQKNWLMKVLTDVLGVDYDSTRKHQLPFQSSADPRFHALDARGVAKLGSHVRRGDALVGRGYYYDEKQSSTSNRQDAFTNEGKRWADHSLFYPYIEPAVVIRSEVTARFLQQCNKCGDLFQVDYRATQCPLCGGLLNKLPSSSLPPGMAARVNIAFSRWLPLQVGDVLEQNAQMFTVTRIVANNEMPVLNHEPALVDVLVHPDSDIAQHLVDTGVLKHSSIGQLNWRKRQTTLGEIAWKRISDQLESKLRARSAGPVDWQTELPSTKFGFTSAQSLTSELASSLCQAGYIGFLAEMLKVKTLDERVLMRTIARKGTFDLCGGASVWSDAFLSILRSAGVALYYDKLRNKKTVDDQDNETKDEYFISFAMSSSKDSQSMSCGEVKNPANWHSHTGLPEPDGLFSERIFGPLRDYRCACGKHAGYRDRGVICDRCGVRASHSHVRRRRAGHIDLASPIVHPWFLWEVDWLAKRLGISQERLRELAAYQTALVDTQDDKQEVEFIEDASLKTSGDAGQRLLWGAHAVQALIQKAGADEYRDVIMDVVLVYPPFLRHARMSQGDGGYLGDTINDCFSSLVSTNLKLRKHIDLSVPQVIIHNQLRMLQAAATALFCNDRLDNPRRDLSGGLLRSLKQVVNEATQRLLNRPVNFSASGLVVSDAKLDADQIGLPKVAILELYRPWLVQLLVEFEDAKDFPEADKLLDQDLPQTLLTKLFTAVLSSQKIVVATETNVVAALRPTLGQGNVLSVHPQKAQDLGITFRGTRLSVHVPVTELACESLDHPEPRGRESSEIVNWRIEQLLELALNKVIPELKFIDRLVFGNAGDFGETKVWTPTRISMLQQD
jgi:hypothetical protein